MPLAFEFARGRISMSLPRQDVSPAIFVDRDGSALLLDAASGAFLDGLTPARAGTRVQILATGLGKVLPSWPLAEQRHWVSRTASSPGCGRCWTGRRWRLRAPHWRQVTSASTWSKSSCRR